MNVKSYAPARLSFATLLACGVYLGACGKRVEGALNGPRDGFLGRPTKDK